MCGSLVRYWLGLEITDGRNATLAANLIGVALATFLVVLMERRGTMNMRHFLLPGFCAGLTTFSTVAGLTIFPQEDGRLFLVPGTRGTRDFREIWLSSGKRDRKTSAIRITKDWT